VNISDTSYTITKIFWLNFHLHLVNEQQLIENKSLFNTHPFHSPECIIDAGSPS
jgi:hypothetical protein